MTWLFMPAATFNLCAVTRQIYCIYTDKHTLGGHLSQQLVRQLLREEHRFPEAEGPVGVLHAEALQVLADVGQAEVRQGRGGGVVLWGTHSGHSVGCSYGCGQGQAGRFKRAQRTDRGPSVDTIIEDGAGGAPILRSFIGPKISSSAPGWGSPFRTWTVHIHNPPPPPPI